MHCICVVYFSVVVWNTLQDLQNYSNYSKLLAITGTAQSHKPFFISKLKNPNPVRIRFLLRKPESGSCRMQLVSGSKKSKIQSMHTSAASLGYLSIGELPCIGKTCCGTQIWCRPERRHADSPTFVLHPSVSATSE